MNSVDAPYRRQGLTPWHFEGDLRLLCWNEVMKALAWVALVLAAFVALGAFLVLIDLVSTKITSENIFAYEDMALALVLLCGSGYVALRSFQRVRTQRHQVDSTSHQ